MLWLCVATGGAGALSYDFSQFQNTESPVFFVLPVSSMRLVSIKTLSLENDLLNDEKLFCMIGSIRHLTDNEVGERTRTFIVHCTMSKF